MSIDDIIDRPTWMANGNCHNMPPEVFYPSQGSDTSVPKAICRECDVQAECLTYAINNGEKHGIWGGKNEDERRAIRRKYGIKHWRESEAKCGTNAGYARHHREQTPPCQSCLQAHATYQADKKAQHRNEAAT